MTDCTLGVTGTRRPFWSTQFSPEAREGCEQNCGVTCLRLIRGSIATDEQVRSLILNILLTDGRRENRVCGWRPGSQGGFWADTFRNDGFSSGTTIRDIPASGSIQDGVNLLQAFLNRDLQRLVENGVVIDVSVDAQYAGNNRVNLTITYTGPDGTNANVGVSADRLAEQWKWAV